MNDFKNAIKDTIPIGIGYLPLSFAFGMMLVHLEGHWTLAPLLSALIYSGTLQFIILPMLVAGLPVVDFIITACVVNARMLFYGLGYPVHLFKQRLNKYLAIATMTDEMYSFMTAKKLGDYTERRLVIAHILGYGYWITGSAIGALIATYLPNNLSGLEFSLAALMLVLCLEQFNHNTKVFPFALGATSAVIGQIALPENGLVVAIALTVIALLITHDTRSIDRLNQRITPS